LACHTKNLVSLAKAGFVHYVHPKERKKAIAARFFVDSKFDREKNSFSKASKRLSDCKEQRRTLKLIG